MSPCVSVCEMGESQGDWGEIYVSVDERFYQQSFQLKVKFVIRSKYCGFVRVHVCLFDPSHSG